MSSESISQLSKLSAKTSAIDHSDNDDTSLYDYELPDELIAKLPLAERDASRMLFLDRHSGHLDHRGIRDLPNLLSPGDCLVLNDTRVLPARLIGVREATGGKWEGLFLGRSENGDWRLIGQTRGHLRPGELVRLSALGQPNSAMSDSLCLKLVAREPDGVWQMRPDLDANFVQLLEHFGTMPLPPYMHRKVASDSDWQRYQTTYARHPGSVAAPTAGLHLTESLLKEIAAREIDIAHVTLHVGLGTFRPISADRLSEHLMHSEWCEVSPSTVETIQKTRQRGGRIIAVGTTCVRTLETASASGELQPWNGSTNLFIRPPYQFRSVDGLLTNFHLPKSTLLVLVSAFAGREATLHAYAEAIRERYRFYSYGDAMLLLPSSQKT